MRGSAAFRAAVAPGGVLAGRWVKNELWRRAKAVPSLDQCFAEDKSLWDRVSGQNLITFTRASSGTFTGSDGLIKTATTNEARFDHNPTTGESLGLLVEEQRTNLLLRSEEFDSASWTKSNTSVTPNAVTAPDGLLTADHVIEDNTTNNHIAQQAFASSVSGTTYTYSCFVKAGQRSFCFLIANGSGTIHAISVNLATGAATTATGSPSNIASVSLGNGWYRVSFAYASGTTGNVNHEIRLSTDGNWANRSYAGNGTSGIYVWGAQLEAGAFPTSYIPTTTATVTRSADVASITGSAFSGFYNQSEGTVFAETSAAAGSGNFGIMSFNASGSGNNRIDARIPSLSLVTTEGTQVAALNNSLSQVAGQVYKTALAYAVDNYGKSTNGSTVATDTSGAVPVGINQLDIGSVEGRNIPVNQPIRRLTYWKQRLPNSTLQEVTR